MLLPNRYTSEATVLVIQQQVPERYVVPTSTTDVSQALQGMTQEVLSRSRLLSIMDELGLYSKEKRGMAPEQIIEQMRRDVSIQPLLENGSDRRNVNSFKISFVSDNPQRAQEVTSRLTSLFIQENEKMREHHATVTTNFLQEHLEAVKKQLTNQEELVRSFKMQHLGDLPEQEQGNVQIMASLSAQLQNTQATLSRAEEHKVYLESLLRGYRGLVSRGAAVPGSPSAGSTASPILTAQNELSRLQSERAALLSAYTVGHPDVRRKDAEIAKAEAVLARLKAAPKPVEEQKTEVPAASSGGTEEDAAIAQVKSQLEQNRVEMANLSKDAERLKAAIAQYQDRLNAAPVREQQLAGMVRDYELLKLNYADLLKKEEESGLAMSLEKSQEGQQFRLVDAPSLPTIPSSPQRLKISAAAAAAGIFLGLALAFFIESTDRSFHSEKQISEHVKLPLVVAVPVLRTSHEERLRKWKAGFEWVAGSVLVLAVLVAELYVYRRG
jgi:polysaccharide chain length determinant protein (PEP-CTERM system associated)